MDFQPRNIRRIGDTWTSCTAAATIIATKVTPSTAIQEDRMINRAVMFIAAMLVLSAGGTATAQSGWTELTSPTGNDLRAVCLRNANTGWIAGAGGDIFKTTDGGDSWSPQSSGVGEILLDISFADANAGVCVGTGGTLLYTTNGGSNWIVAQTGYIETYHGVHMVTNQAAYAVGVNAIFQPFVAKTIDGGQSWSFNSFYINNSEGTLTDVYFVDVATGFATARIWDGTGAIVRTTDGGSTWDDVYTHPQSALSIDFPTSEVGVVGARGMVFRTEDGGATWDFQSTGPARDLNGISFPDIYIGTVAGTEGTIRRTFNAGSTWRQQDSGTLNELFDVEFPEILIGYAVGEGGMILKTETGGLSPSSVNDLGHSGPVLTLAPAQPNPFSGKATLRYTLAEDATVTLILFNVSGRRLRTLVSGPRAAGAHRVEWDGLDDSGFPVDRGLVFVRLQGTTGGRIVTTIGRMIYLGR
jgi:photosystem II stability/assembly factor-like uncharacterized protein